MCQPFYRPYHGLWLEKIEEPRTSLPRALFTRTNLIAKTLIDIRARAYDMRINRYRALEEKALKVAIELSSDADAQATIHAACALCRIHLNLPADSLLGEAGSEFTLAKSFHTGHAITGVQINLVQFLNLARSPESASKNIIDKADSYLRSFRRMNVQRHQRIIVTECRNHRLARIRDYGRYLKLH